MTTTAPPRRARATTTRQPHAARAPRTPRDAGPGDFLARATAYARAIAGGKIAASQLTRRACERHLRDLERQGSAAFPWLLSAQRAEHICRFAELVPHVKGEWAKRGELIRLEDWQVFILVSLFGWVHAESGYRRFRTGYIEIPRKNAKSTLGAIIALYMLALDGEAGADCYSAATTRDQARIVFDSARVMAQKMPQLQARFGVQIEKHRLFVPGTNSVCRPITREQSANEGLNVHLGLCDELHAHKSDDIYEVLDQAKGAHRNALLLSITTAGSNTGSICYTVRSMIVAILDGLLTDEEYERVWGIIYTIDDEDSPDDPAVWRKANPNLGVSVFEDDLVDQHAKARASPARWAEFMTKRLNVWVQVAAPWFNVLAWRERCLAAELAQHAPAIPQSFDGRRCFIGIDFATRRDIAALAVVFPDADGSSFDVFARYYLPAERVQEARQVLYDGWVRAGWITATPGETTDFAFIARDLREWAQRFDIAEIPFDPHEARQFATEMVNEYGLPMVEVRQGYTTFNEPMKLLDSLIVQGRIRHNGDPVLAWAIGNVVGKIGAYEDVMPKRESDEAKIDPAIALLMALGRAALAQPQKPGGISVYIPGEVR